MIQIKTRIFTLLIISAVEFCISSISTKSEDVVPCFSMPTTCRSDTIFGILSLFQKGDGSPTGQLANSPIGPGLHVELDCRSMIFGTWKPLDFGVPLYGTMGRYPDRTRSLTLSSPSRWRRICSLIECLRTLTQYGHVLRLSSSDRSLAHDFAPTPN